tara:strand:- start:890 stop:1087 length:198 start_codon:yes stop_codon:yes gene_type:complete
MKDSVYDFVDWYLSETNGNIQSAIEKHVSICFSDPKERAKALDEIKEAVEEHPELHWPGLMHDYP